jgi:heme oxygenase (mycobilin-producing)
MHATPLLAQSLDEPSAYELLAEATPGGELVISASDRA